MRASRHLRGQRWPAWLLLAALHGGIAAFFLCDRSPGTDAALTGLPLDDAWIHLVYGRSVAQSGLPYYNPGELEAGFTSPAWVVVCAAAHWLAGLLGLNIVLALKILGTLSAMAMTWGVHELTGLCTRSGLAAFVAGALSAMTPALAFSQVSGMEVCLAACFGLWAICAWHRRWYLTTGLLLAFAFWARPEMLVLCGLVVVALLRECLDDFSSEKRAALLKAALPTLAFAVLWGGYCLAVTGRVLPNTFYAKFSSGHPQGFLTVLREVVWMLPANYLLAGVVSYALGVVGALRRSASVYWVVLLFPWCFLLAIGGSRPIPSGSANYYYWLRYVVPALPFLYPPMASGWRFLWPLLKAGPPPERPDGPARHPGLGEPVVVWGRCVLAALLAVLCLVGHPGALRRTAAQYAWNCQNIDEVQVVIGQWVAQHTPEEAAIVVNDAGALRYIGQRRTIDLMGLNCHELAHNRKHLLEIIASPIAMRDFMRTRQARYLIVFPPFFPGILESPGAELLFEAVFQARSDNYTIAPAPQELMVVYELRRSDWP